MSTLAFLEGIGSPIHWVIVLVIALLLFGRRLPEVGRSLGKGITEFKKGLKDVGDQATQDTDDTQRQQHSYQTPLPPRTPQQPSPPLPPRAAANSGAQQVRVNRNDMVD